MVDARSRLASPRKELPGETLVTYTFLRCLGELLEDEASAAEFIAACERAVKVTLFERSTGLNLETLKMFAPLTEERFGAFAGLFVSPEFGAEVATEHARILDSRAGA